MPKYGFIAHIGGNDCPCKDCDHRALHCHDKCGPYKSWHEALKNNKRAYVQQHPILLGQSHSYIKQMQLEHRDKYRR